MVNLIIGKKMREIHQYVLTFIWYSCYLDNVIKKKCVKPFKAKVCPDKLYNGTAIGMYFTSQHVKINFYITYIYCSKIITHHFHVDSNEIVVVVGYNMIIWGVMGNMGFFVELKCNILYMDGGITHMRDFYPVKLLPQY